MITRRFTMVVLGVVFLWGVASAEVVVPTPEFLAAALKNQETLCGPSLEVVYETTGDKENRTPGFRVTYVRTPDVLFCERTDGVNGDGIRKKTSYDRNTHEYRVLEVSLPQKPGDESSRLTTGLIRNYLDYPFNLQSSIETSRFAIFEGILCEIITKGTVASSQESIDGHECWRVTVPSTKPGVIDNIVWLDGDIGFCPRRITLGWEGRPAPKVISFRDYREIKPGVWFPYEQVNEVNNADRGSWLLNSVISATAGKAFSNDQLLITFPSGITVTEGGSGEVSSL